MQPADYRVERSATMAVPPATPFALVNDFHHWNSWSPWAKHDPNAQYTYDGPTAGVGAIMKWTGNDDVGEGKMTILESKPGEFIKIDLEFFKPFPSRCDTEFRFKPVGDNTIVTWTMAGTNGLVAKAFCLFIDMDKMIGGDFERGLNQMKTIIEPQ